MRSSQRANSSWHSWQLGVGSYIGAESKHVPMNLVLGAFSAEDQVLVGEVQQELLRNENTDNV